MSSTRTVRSDLHDLDYRNNFLKIMPTFLEGRSFSQVQGYHTFKRNNDFAYVQVRVQEATQNQIASSAGMTDENEWAHIQMSSSEYAEAFKDYKDLTGRKRRSL